MKILIIGGTRFFGRYTVEELLKEGHEITIATRGRTPDLYGSSVKRIIVERTSKERMKEALNGRHYDVVVDKLAYCSNDIRYAMEALDCARYIHMSSTAVYEPKHLNTLEADFDPSSKSLVWCSRGDFPYDELKRQAECALWQEYPHRSWVAVRYPFVLGRDDYTQRLQFYVEHAIKSVPMRIDNPDSQMSFIRSDEAGNFIAFLALQDVKGAVNGSAAGTISLREILEYVEKRTGKRALIDEKGEEAPYNGEPEYSINTEKAEALGFQFSVLKDWIYELLDDYIQACTRRFL